MLDNGTHRFASRTPTVDPRFRFVYTAPSGWFDELKARIGICPDRLAETHEDAGPEARAGSSGASGGRSATSARTSGPSSWTTSMSDCCASTPMSADASGRPARQATAGNTSANSPPPSSALARLPWYPTPRTRRGSLAAAPRAQAAMPVPLGAGAAAVDQRPSSRLKPLLPRKSCVNGEK